MGLASASLFLGWGLPAWIINSLLALIVDRAVRAMYNGNPGPLRRLMRSLGMGGTSSPLSWAMGYDPIIAALVVALHIKCPTYVDDLVALPRAPPNKPFGLRSSCFSQDTRQAYMW